VSEAITVWIGAFVTLTVLSYLVRENIVYRLVQSAALGCAIAFALVISWQQVLKPRWAQPILDSSTATFGWPAASEPEKQAASGAAPGASAPTSATTSAAGTATAPATGATAPAAAATAPATGAAASATATSIALSTRPEEPASQAASAPASTAAAPQAKGLPWFGMLWILALVPGALWYFQLSKRWFWLSTIISGLFVGVAAGLAFKGQMLLILPQISASIKPLNPWALPGGWNWDNVLTVFDNLVFLVLLFAALLYFFFSLKASNPLMGRPLRLGRIAIMTCLGSMFGGTVITRLGYLLDRLMMLYNDWYVGQIKTPLQAFFHWPGA
jgi:hypothetical protein